jgi:ankyrin repeat protein
VQEPLNGTSLLIQASYLQKYDIVKYLIKLGGDINHQDFYGQTPLMYHIY